MGIANEVKALTESYRTVSVDCVKDLCFRAGTQYKEPTQAKELYSELFSMGYRLKIQKFTEVDKGVGQYLVLTDLNEKVVYGYKVWIDFDGYSVKKQAIEEGTILYFIGVGAIN